MIWSYGVGVWRNDNAACTDADTSSTGIGHGCAKTVQLVQLNCALNCLQKKRSQVHNWARNRCRKM